MVVDTGPVGGCLDLLPELKAIGDIGAGSGACGRRVRIGELFHRIGAEVVGLGIIGGDLRPKDHIVQSIRCHLLVQHLGDEALDLHALDGGAAVVLEAQFDIAVVQSVGIVGRFRRPAVADDLGRSGLAHHRQGQVFLIPLHRSGQLQPGIEAHGHAAVHIEGPAAGALVEDAVLPVGVIELDGRSPLDQLVGGAVFPAGQRPGVLEGQTAGRSAVDAYRGVGQKVVLVGARIDAVEIADAVDVIEGMLGLVDGGHQVTAAVTLIPAVHHRVHVADHAVVIGVDKQAASAGVAPADEARAVDAVDIAVFHQAIDIGSQSAVVAALGGADQIAAQSDDEVPQGTVSSD